MAQESGGTVGTAASGDGAVVALRGVPCQHLSTAAREPAVRATGHRMVIAMLGPHMLAQHLLKRGAIAAARVRGPTPQRLARVQPHVPNHRVLGERTEATDHAAVGERRGRRNGQR